MNEPQKRKLTPKEERFCYEYLACGMNATKAAIKAGYSKKTATEIGRQNLLKLVIQERIQYMKDNLAETAGITATMIAAEHAKIAFNSIAHLHNTWIELKEFNQLTDDQKACIQEISTKVMKVKSYDGVTNDVEYVRIKLYDKQRALDSLTNLLGFNAPVKKEITGKDGKDLIPYEGKTYDQVKAELMSIVSKINE
jgi:phage terminase small subunit